MSGVPVRLRNISQFEFYNTAIDIRVRITRLVTSSAVPKSYRFTFAVPMAQTARSMVYNIVTADAFYPNSEDAVTLRKRHLTLAIADCEQLYQDMQCLLAMGLPVPVSRLDEISEALDREIELLKGARKGVKLIGKR
ncbi:hypothetical protein [Enorma sp.]|uniref:hypothetical protein n=1 Tax=Enorma sp. TaxID=1920692 RepID=UPI0025BEB4CF|nr:hypothetical protein [Enorma sp.]